jgi:hypothetical protein
VRFGYDKIGKFPPATVVAARTGGASQSKWARKTRPWNANLQTTVVACFEIEKSYFEDIEFMSTALYETVGSHDVLRPHSRRR